MAPCAADRVLDLDGRPWRVATPTLRSKRSCAIRDRSGSWGKNFGQGGGPSHALALWQSLQHENAPRQGLSKFTAHKFSAEREGRAHA